VQHRGPVCRLGVHRRGVREALTRNGHSQQRCRTNGCWSIRISAELSIVMRFGFSDI
jgi:hypothetical protein